MTDQHSTAGNTAGSDGPWLQIAAFCERTLNEKDGVISLIRVIDQITTRGSVVPDKPNAMPASAIAVSAVIAIKAGTSGSPLAKHVLTVNGFSPSGRKMEGSDLELPFVFPTSEGNAGAQILVNMNMEVDEVGVYWFDVVVDGHRLTRMPLKIAYVTQKAGT